MISRGKPPSKYTTSSLSRTSWSGSPTTTRTCWYPHGRPGSSGLPTRGAKSCGDGWRNPSLTFPTLRQCSRQEPGGDHLCNGRPGVNEIRFVAEGSTKIAGETLVYHVCVRDCTGRVYQSEECGADMDEPYIKYLLD